MFYFFTYTPQTYFPMQGAPSLDQLPQDILVRIAELVSPKDIRSLRLVCKRFKAAVECVSISLKPAKDFQANQLSLLSHAFHRATSLDLAECTNLTANILTSFPSLFPNLDSLRIPGDWVASEPNSESLIFAPPNLHKLFPNLRKLTLSRSSTMTTLPEAIPRLASLETLELSVCLSLAHLPDEISQLTSLCALELFGCYSIRELPDGFSRLSSLRWLDILVCQALEALPARLGALSELRELYLTSCPRLEALPASLTGSIAPRIFLKPFGGF